MKKPTKSTVIKFTVFFVLLWITLSFAFNFLYNVIHSVNDSLTPSFEFKLVYLFCSPIPLITQIMICTLLAGLLTYKLKNLKNETNETAKGDARWMNNKDLKKLIKSGQICEIDERYLTEAEKSGIILAKKKNTLYVDITTTHSIIIGTTRSGKTQTFVLPILREMVLSKQKPSIVLNDPKGEVLEKTYSLFEENGYKVVVLNLKDTNISSLWSPLQIIIDEYVKIRKAESDDFSSLNPKISSLALLFTENTKSDPIWPKSAQSLLESILLLLLEIAYDNDCLDKLNMYSLYTIFAEFGGHDAYFNKNGQQVKVNALEQLFSNLPAGSPIKNAYTTAKFAEGEMLSSMLSTLASNIEIFGRDTGIQKLTSGNEINFDDLINPEKPCAIFMVIPDNNPARHEIASLFIDQCYNHLVERSEEFKDKKLPVTVHFFLDEFGNMVRIPGMDNKITVSAGRNILFELVLQDLNQLDNKYNSISKTIRGNCGNFFYINSLDDDTNKYFSSLLDNKTQKYETYSGDLSDWVLSHKNVNIDSRPLLSAGQLSRLEMGDIVLRRQRCYPIKSKFPFFYEFNVKETNLNDIPINHSDVKLKDILFPIDLLWDKYNKSIAHLYGDNGEEDIILEVDRQTGEVLSETKAKITHDEKELEYSDIFKFDNEALIKNKSEAEPLDHALFEINKLTNNAFNYYLDKKDYTSAYRILMSGKIAQNIDKPSLELLRNHLDNLKSGGNT